VHASGQVPSLTRLSGESASHAPRGSVAALTVAAAGIVYGDIGTSSLYAVDQIFLSHCGIPLTTKTRSEAFPS